MPTKTTEAGREYVISGKALTWTPLQFDGEPVIPDIHLPLRIKLRSLLDIGESKAMSNNENMMAMVSLVAPTQKEKVMEMDINDFREMVDVWMGEYSTLTGVSLGESSASPSSSPSTEAPLNSTGEPVSVPSSPTSVEV